MQVLVHLTEGGPPNPEDKNPLVINVGVGFGYGLHINEYKGVLSKYNFSPVSRSNQYDVFRTTLPNPHTGQLESHTVYISKNGWIYERLGNNLSMSSSKGSNYTSLEKYLSTNKRFEED